MQVDNLPIKDKLPTIADKEELQRQIREALKKLDGVPQSAKPELQINLTVGDYKNLAKSFFLENFQAILKLGISGNVFRLAIVGVILALLLLFWTGVL